jgi:ubiquinone/menaquinone biosynthesis C-methylase UbiE
MGSSAYREKAPEYDRRWSRYTRDSLGLLRPYLAERPDTLLDVGCGTAALVPALAAWDRAPRRYVGVDPSAAMLRVAAARVGAGALIRCGAEPLPLADASAEAVVTSSSLHEWPDPAAAMREIHRVLIPGGRLLVVDWCADFATIRLMRRWLSLTRRPVRQVLTGSELGGMLEDSGFRVAALTRHRVSPVWGLMVAEARRG